MYRVSEETKDELFYTKTRVCHIQNGSPGRNAARTSAQYLGL